MQKIKKSKLIIVNSSDFSGVYQDMVENLGVEVTSSINRYDLCARYSESFYIDVS